MQQTSAKPATNVSPLISQARDALREEIANLTAGWHRQIQRVFEERFAQLTERIERQVQTDLAARRERSGPSGLTLDGEASATRLRAQSFARVRAAEIRLYKSQAVLDGRARKAVYAELKEEIDSARAAYEREFLHASVAMPDYLHMELVRTLADDEPAALGEGYPGPLA